MQRRTYPSGAGYPFPANGKGFLFAPVLWFVWFVAIYALQGGGCAAGFDDVGVLGTSALRLTLGLLTALTAAAIAVVGFWSFSAFERARERSGDGGDPPLQQSMFLSYGALLHAALFFVATLWIGIPILMADPCSP